MKKSKSYFWPIIIVLAVIFLMLIYYGAVGTIKMGIPVGLP
jgi:hypothetical protein